MIHFNQGGVTTIKAKNGEAIKSVDSFEYLGGWLESFAKEILKSERLWHGQLVTGWGEYGNQIWEASRSGFHGPCRIYPALWQRHGKDMDMKAIEKKLDGCLPKCYVWYLICLGKINWPTRNYMEIYHQCHQKWVSEGWSLAGHCVRHPEEEASSSTSTLAANVWTLEHGKTSCYLYR